MMKVLLDILNSEKTNLGKLELVKWLEDELEALKDEYDLISIDISTILYSKTLDRNIEILESILNEIKTKPTWEKNQLKDLFLDKALNNL